MQQTSAKCSNCGEPILGEEGFGMVMCEKCGELVMLEKPSPVFADVVDFANTEQPAPGSGVLVYDVKIGGIDTVEIREELASCLNDKRLHLDADHLLSQVKNGILTLSALHPVKATVILSRLKHMPLKIIWSSRQLVKDTTVVLAFLFILFSVKSFAGEWAQHEADLKSYALRIVALQDDLKKLIIKKDKNTDLRLRDGLLDQIKKKDEEINRVYQNFRQEKEHVIYEHPEQGDTTERKYKHIKLKSYEDLENEAGADGQLSRLKAKVEKTYP